jgi:hypothetical protein
MKFIKADLMSRENNKNAKEEYEIIIRGEKC